MQKLSIRVEITGTKGKYSSFTSNSKRITTAKTIYSYTKKIGE